MYNANEIRPFSPSSDICVCERITQIYTFKSDTPSWPGSRLNKSDALLHSLLISLLKARSDLVIPLLQPGDNVIPQLFNIIQTVKGWHAFSTFNSPKISRFFGKKNYSLA